MLSAMNVESVSAISGMRILGLKAFEQAPAYKGAQDAPTQAGLSPLQRP